MRKLVNLNKKYIYIVEIYCVIFLHIDSKSRIMVGCMFLKADNAVNNAVKKCSKQYIAEVPSGEKQTLVIDVFPKPSILCNIPEV